jgi:tetratricopeptide (TPR) repeat protein
MKNPVRRQKDQPLSPSTNPLARQICAERDITGIASSGDQSVNIQNRAERITQLPAEAFVPMTAVDAPPGLTNLPARPRLFVGRATEIAHLDKTLPEAGGTVVQAVYGLGGVGKTTLAAHWAARHATRHTLTWWITADNRSGIEADLASLARALQPSLADLLSPDVLRERAVQWLASHQGWLVVLDNVTNPTDISPLLAQASTGRYLITSRRASGWHNLAESIQLDVMQSDEAVKLFTQIVAPSGLQDLNGTRELCTKLGFLPLAIEQASAYVDQTGITVQDYLKLLDDYPAAVYRATAEGGDAARTVARIWRITLDRLADEPLAIQVLRLLAWYAPNSIPRSLLNGFASPLELTSAIGRLAAYSMITASPAALSVHRLVQAVARTPEPGDPHRDPQTIDTARDQATAQLAAAIPDDDPAEWPTWRILLPHITALVSHSSASTDTKITANLLHQVGSFLLGQGQLAQATEYLQRAIAGRERIVDSGDPDILKGRNNLACVYLEAGDTSQAITLFEENLANQQRVLSSEHPDVFTSRNNLARAHMDAGHLAQAITLFEQNLGDRQRVLGKDDHDTLTSRNNLARAYTIAKDTSRAIALFKENLAELDRVLGSDHRHTLTARNNLACAYLEAGDTSQAITLFEENLANQQRVLGSEHPETLDCLNDLAGAYQAAGDTGRAITLFEENFADRLRVLGPDHPKLLASRNNIARAYQAAKSWDEAIRLFEQNLAELQRVLGDDHPETMAGRYSLVLQSGFVM